MSQTNFNFGALQIESLRALQHLNRTSQPEDKTRSKTEKVSAGGNEHGVVRNQKTAI